jgi:hypothetical protein
MASNEDILQLIDGGLSSHDEAELLHRLSVSPERRQVLRSFLQQKELVEKDLAKITVPYAAEQKLWQRLGAVMPPAVAPIVTDIPVGVASVGILAQLMRPVVGSVVGLTLLIGAGIGYLVSDHNPETKYITIAGAPRNDQSDLSRNFYEQPASNAINGGSQRPNYRSGFDRSVALMTNFVQMRTQNVAPLSGEQLSALFLQRIHDPAESALIAQKDDIASAEMGDIHAIEGHSETLSNSIGGDHPKTLHAIASFEDQHEKTFLQRFEFSFLESFGREFPNSSATNVSMPIVTNSALGVYFQVLPHSNVLWIGANGGTANLTRKHLLLHAGDPGDPLQQQMEGEFTHVQTNWAGGFLQLRVPFIGQSDFTMSGGYGLATAGKLMMAEVGLHIDATRDVGFITSVRGVRLQYDLASEKDAILNSVHGPLVIPHGVADANASFNLEFNTGLYFHF